MSNWKLQHFKLNGYLNVPNSIDPTINDWPQYLNEDYGRVEHGRHLGE